MDIQTENQIDGQAAKRLRERATLSQKAFWGAYNVTQAGGSRYEQGKSQIPVPIKRLIFAEHVAGLQLNASTSGGAAAVLSLGQIITADQIVTQAKRVLSAINQ